MRWQVISDIHANVLALQAALADAGSVDGVVCLGDIVGYGPRPNECCDLLRDVGAVCLAGNHEDGILSGEYYKWGHAEAREVAEWTDGRLTTTNRRFLGSLSPVAEHAIGLLMHGSATSVWEYMDTSVAGRLFTSQSVDVGFFGHVHVPQVILRTVHAPESGRPLALYDGFPVQLAPGHRPCICNPGSVGQPRDFDPRAAYAIYDTDHGQLSVHRAEYDIAAVQADLTQLSLPEFLIRRIFVGL